VKGRRSKESIVYQRENVERRSGGESGTIPSWRWKFISSALVPPSPLTSYPKFLSLPTFILVMGIISDSDVVGGEEDGK